MNEKPGLEPGFFARRAAGGLTGYALLPVPRTCLSCHFGVGLARAWKRAISWELAHYWRTYSEHK